MLMFKGFALRYFWINSNHWYTQLRGFLKHRSLLIFFVDFFGSLTPKAKNWDLTLNLLKHGYLNILHNSLENTCNEKKLRTPTHHLITRDSITSIYLLIIWYRKFSDPIGRTECNYIVNFNTLLRKKQTLRSRETAMFHYIASTFRDSIYVFVFWRREKKDNAVKLRPYLEIFYNRFVQVRCF